MISKDRKENIICTVFIITDKICLVYLTNRDGCLLLLVSLIMLLYDRLGSVNADGLQLFRLGTFEFGQ